MLFDGPVLVVTRMVESALVRDLSQAIASGVLPLDHAEAAAVVRSAAPAAIVLLDSAPNEDVADDLTAAVLTSDHFIPIIRRWAAVDAERLTTLWLAAEADATSVHTALQQAVRVRTLLLETLRRRTVVSAAEFGAPPNPDPWGPARDVSVLVIDNGSALPRIAPICAARGMSLVGAPATTVAGTYLEHRHFDAVVIGASIEPNAAEAFLSWLRDDPRRRDLPAFWLCDHPGRAARAPFPTDVLQPDDRRLASALYAAGRLHAFTSVLTGALKDMNSAGLADPETGLLWPDAFRAGVIQTMAWAEAMGRDFVVLRIVADHGRVMPASVGRIVARLLRRSDLVSRIDDGLIVAALVGTDHDNAGRVAARISGVLAHTALAAAVSGQGVTVQCVRAEPREQAQGFLARLGALGRSTAALAGAAG